MIEDLHWADPTTREFMGELMSAADAEQIVWLMTSRVAPQREIAQYNVLCVETLDPLLPGEAAELARATSGHRQLTAFQLAEIVDRADGVPLYIEEFVRAVANFEHTDKKTNEGRIPTTLRGLVDEPPPCAARRSRRCPAGVCAGAPLRVSTSVPNCYTW